MKRTILSRAGIVGPMGVALLLAACGGQDDVHSTEGMEGMPGMGSMQGMQGTDDMHRHAQELDGMTPRMRDHIQQMRQLSPEQQHERMGEHVGELSQMLTLMNRQMGEMGMGMSMSDEQMGEMMGMSGEEHRRMVEEMQGIRAELEELQTASPDEVRERMPAHLDRTEGMVHMMEGSAEHMRSTPR